MAIENLLFLHTHTHTQKAWLMEGWDKWRRRMYLRRCEIIQINRRMWQIGEHHQLESSIKGFGNLAEVKTSSLELSKARLLQLRKGKGILAIHLCSWLFECLTFCYTEKNILGCVVASPTQVQSNCFGPLPHIFVICWSEAHISWLWYMSKWLLFTSVVLVKPLLHQMKHNSVHQMV